MSDPAHGLPINVVIVGAGLIGPRHAESVRACAGLSLSCLVDPSPDAGQIASQYGVPLFTTTAEMLAMQVPRPDAAVVCTPNNTHVAISTELLLAGVHVLVEKPIAVTVESGRELVDAARRADKILLVGHHRRFNPYMTATKQALADGQIGQALAISGLWTLCKPESYFTGVGEWRAQTTSGGPVWINLIHEVDILQFLFGRITRVHAEQMPRQRRHAVEEGAALLLRFASGLVGTFILADATPSSHSFESGTGENPLIPRSGKDFYRIFGSEGTLSVGDMKLSRYDQGAEKSWSNPLHDRDVPVGTEVPFDEQMQHFLRVIRGQEQPRCSGEDGLSAVMVCEAVKQALASGEAVNVKVP